MFVEVLLDVVLVGVGDGDVFVAKDDAEAVYLFDLGHVDDVAAVGAQELGTGQIVFEFLHTHKRHNALSVSEMDADVVLEAFDEEDVVEDNALQLVFALDIHEAVGGAGLLATHEAEPFEGLVRGAQEVVVGDGFQQIVEG